MGHLSKPANNMSSNRYWKRLPTTGEYRKGTPKTQRIVGLQTSGTTIWSTKRPLKSENYNTIGET